MNSSISNFRSELKVVAVVLAVLLACEVGMRLVEKSLSLDVRHIRDIPRIVETMKAGEGTEILFLGNSLTRCSVNQSVLITNLTELGIAPVSIATVYPDGSSILIWHYVLKNFFINSDNIPDVLVVNFAAKHLQDGQAFNVPAMGSFYAAARDIPEVFLQDIRNFGDQTEFLLSMASTAFANRSRVPPRVLDAIAPNYRSSMERINMSTAVANKRARGGVQKPTYERLARFLEAAKGAGIRVVFVALPTAEPYELDPVAEQLIEGAGMHFIDARQSAALPAEYFPDGYHMNEAGGALYSEKLAKILAPLLPSPGGETVQ